MGAGAATIAGMELNDLMHDNMTVEKVVGFGCPALLSQDLAEQVSPFVSTIINDNDMIVSHVALLFVCYTDSLPIEYLTPPPYCVRPCLDGNNHCILHCIFT